MSQITSFGWDQSHYDDPMTVRDGIDYITHKVAEGHHFYKDTEYKPALENARKLGVPVLGAYYVNHPGTIQDQVDWFLEIINAETPWWCDVPFMLQIDAEKFGYMAREPSIDEINGFGDLLCNRTSLPSTAVFAYAPPWLYGEKLRLLKYPLWSSNYGSNPTTHYKTAYPGDSSTRWTPFSGSNVAILQYGSNTTIGNQTTCDANAWRGITYNGVKFPGTIEGLQDFIGSRVEDPSMFATVMVRDTTTNKIWLSLFMTFRVELKTEAIQSAVMSWTVNTAGPDGSPRLGCGWHWTDKSGKIQKIVDTDMIEAFGVEVPFAAIAPIVGISADEARGIAIDVVGSSTVESKITPPAIAPTA